MKRVIPINTTVEGFAYAIKAVYYKTSLVDFTMGGGHFPSTGVIEYEETDTDKHNG